MPDIKLILETLAQYRPVMIDPTPESAAVMILLLSNEDQACEIVLTERSAKLPTYAGDYSFPGGIRDFADTNLYATAVREIQEELNIPPDSYQHIGQLDDFLDKYGRLVRPFVATMNKENFEKLCKTSHDEIERIYYFALPDLVKIQDNPMLRHITRRSPAYSFREGDVFVWGLTAAILVHLSNIINHENKSLGKKPTE
jgi:8-oxo-dGTP pyrophosphatase MutT (NUDIX family)